MYIRLVLFGLLALSSSGTLRAQLINFDILLFGDKVGNVVVNRQVLNDSVERYTLESRSKANILWIKRENYTRYEVEYHHGHLFRSDSYELENGQKKRWCTLRYTGSGYVLTGNKGTTTLTEVPVFSIVKLFFTDATRQPRIFHELEGNFAELKHPAANVCEFTASDGSRNTYYYDNGLLTHLEFHVSIATVKLVRTN